MPLMTEPAVRHVVDNDLFFAALYEGHAGHRSARRWLDAHKPFGWGIAVETHLAAMRLLMNPAILGTAVLDGARALQVVATELRGPHPGRVLFSTELPDPAIFSRATGHRQIMDYWLVQVAHAHGARLATRDKALHRHWPDRTVYAG